MLFRKLFPPMADRLPLAEGRRLEALRLALQTVGHTAEPNRVLSAALAYESYLSGAALTLPAQA